MSRRNRSVRVVDDAAHLCGSRLRVDHVADVGELSFEDLVGIGIDADTNVCGRRHPRQILLVDVSKDPHRLKVGDGHKCTFGLDDLADRHVVGGDHAVKRSAYRRQRCRTMGCFGVSGPSFSSSLSLIPKRWICSSMRSSVAFSRSTAACAFLNSARRNSRTCCEMALSDQRFRALDSALLHGHVAFRLPKPCPRLEYSPRRSPN